MNIKFTGNITVFPDKLPEGYSSEAAKAAFHDIREDKDMRVHVEIFGVECLCNIILSETILNTQDT